MSLDQTGLGMGFANIEVAFERKLQRRKCDVERDGLLDRDQEKWKC